ncbi:MAG: carboxypeptidase-like regulatory domain-containing protein [Gemmataceae bacterium]|nr:carboxypeptidase-like regulatory domain-containing protein [Gemmataceae bacterium]
MRARITPGCLLGAALVVAAGCGGGAKPVKVAGRVTLDNQPLPGATIVFTPDGGTGNIASGRTDDAGEFQLTTFGPDDGAVPGDYKITVKVDGVLDTPLEGDPMNMDDAAKTKFFMKMSAKTKAAEEKEKKERKKRGERDKADTSLVPPVYRDITKTPLKQRVPADGKVEINLKSNAK